MLEIEIAPKTADTQRYEEQLLLRVAASAGGSSGSNGSGKNIDHKPVRKNSDR